MFFWKSKIEKAFHFLKKNGFHLKKYTRFPDEECVYSKKNIVLEVDYYIGVNFIGKTGMYVAVILTADGKRDNLLNHNQVFDGRLLETLKTNVEAVTPLEQITIYADFIKTNLDTLLQYIKN